MSTREEPVLGNEFYESEKANSTSARAARWLDYLRPSIFSRTTATRKAQLRPTAYLDGLRGFAAFLVYWGHHHLWARETIHADNIFENVWGYEGQYYFVQLHGIRTFFSGGHYSVTVFFVISGYVLSTKPLSLIHAGEQLKLADNLASALFRRWLRLHIPMIVVTWFYITSWWAFGILTDAKKRAGSYTDELYYCYAEFKNFSFAYRTGGESWFTYSFHMWSIPVEFRGSLIIYTSVLAFSRLKKNARLAGEIALIFYFLYIVDGWFGAMFLSGMLLCDLDMLAQKEELPHFFTRLEPFKRPIFYALFVISVFLGGCPSHSADINLLRASPGWYYLSFLTPQAAFDFKWFYLFWASTLLVACIPRIPWLRRFFETRFCQYMGRISFSFYLVHGPIMWTLGDRIYTAVGWVREWHEINTPQWVNLFPLSKTGPMGFELAFLVPHLIILPFTLWLAEVVTKAVDGPSVTFSQWLYNTLVGTADKSETRHETRLK